MAREVGRTLQRMERDGLITRRPDPEDRRRTRIHLSPRAHDIRAELVAGATTVNERAVQGVSGVDLETFGTVLHQIADNLAAGSGERHAPPLA